MVDLIILRRASRVFSFLAALIVSLSLSADESGAATAAKMTGWSIDSTSNMMGTVSCKFTDDAVYMRLDKMGLVIITTAPKWNMFVYNDVNKNYMNMTREQWQKRFGSGLMAKRSTKEPIVTVATNKEQKILGFSAEQFLVKRKIKDKETVSMELWLTKGLTGPEQLKALFRTFLNMPQDFKGMPLRVLSNQNGHLVPLMDAYKVTKTTFTKDTFQTLKGYKEVKDEMALMMDDSDEKGAEGLLGTTTTPPGKSAPGAPGSVTPGPVTPGAKPSMTGKPAPSVAPLATGKPLVAAPAATGKPAPEAKPKSGFPW
jgi:hypothetical protein